MAIYQWEGRGREGGMKRGSVSANNEAAALAQLRAQSIAPTKLKVKPRDLAELVPFLARRVKAKDIVVFTRQ